MSEPRTATSTRDPIDRVNRELDACLVRGDLMSYAGFYSDDATIIGFDKQKIHGREAIARFCLEMTGVMEANAVVPDVGSSGDFNYHVATSFASGNGTAKRAAISAIACTCGAGRERHLPHLPGCLQHGRSLPRFSLAHD